MVHVFEFDGENYVFDNESSTFFSADKSVIETIKKLNNENYDFTSFSDSELLEAENEILGLKKEGLIFKEEAKEVYPKSTLLKALCLHICHDCNLKCEYCFASEGTYQGKRESMSEQVGKKAVDFLIENSGNRKILEMDFFGGEPLMNLDVVKEIVYYAKEQGKIFNKTFLFTLTTNGVLLSDEVIDFLNEEMENVVLSIDGRKETHDNIRKTLNNKGSFEIVFKRIQEFVKKRGDKSYYVRGTFTNKNLDFSKDVLFLADNGLKEISLEPVVLDKEHKLYIANEALPQIKAEYRKLTREFLKRKKEGKPFNFFHFVIDVEGGPCIKKRINACGAGNEYFSVTPKGELYPCHQFTSDPKYLMGNIFEGKIDENIRRMFSESSLYTRQNCGNCFAKYHCSGGCAANNINFNGDINIPYEITCEMMKERTECALHILSKTKE